MIFSALIFFFMVAGSLACSDTHCKDRELGNELMEVMFLPDKHQLKTLCPKVMTFLECEREYFECPGQSLDELASSSDKSKAKIGKAMLNGMSLVRDICDEDSSFHKDYVASVDCSRDFLQGSARMCRRLINDPIEKFFDDLYPSAEEMSEEAYAEIRCLSDALEVVCIMDHLGELCGSVAQRTAMDALERMEALVKGSCEDVENSADLKIQFLNFLELDDDRRGAVQGVFDLFKRRR